MYRLVDTKIRQTIQCVCVRVPFFNGSMSYFFWVG